MKTRQRIPGEQENYTDLITRIIISGLKIIYP